MMRCAPSSPDGTTCEWTSTKKLIPRGYPRPRLLLRQVELEVRCDRAKLAQRARLELADALARDPETRPDLLERLRLLAVEPEAEREHLAHARVEAVERANEFAVSHRVGSRQLWPVGLRVLDQVAVERLAVADGRLEAHRLFDELQQILHLLDRQLGRLGELGDRRLAVELLRQHPARAHQAAHLVGHVHREADDPALVGERARDRLADPP